MTLWSVSVVLSLALLVAARVLRSSEPRGSRYIAAVALGVLVLMAPIAAAGEFRYRRCLRDPSTSYSHCNWLRANPWG